MERIWQTKDFTIEIIDFDYEPQCAEINCGMIHIKFYYNGKEYTYDEYVVDNVVDCTAESQWEVMEDETIAFLKSLPQGEEIRDWLVEQATIYIDENAADFEIDSKFIYDMYCGNHRIIDDKGEHFYFNSKQEACAFVQSRHDISFVTAVRGLLGYTQKELAHVLQFSRRHVCGIENGEVALRHTVRVTLENLIKGLPVFHYSDDKDQTWVVRTFENRAMFTLGNWHETFDVRTDAFKNTSHYEGTKELLKMRDSKYKVQNAAERVRWYNLINSVNDMISTFDWQPLPEECGARIVISDIDGDEIHKTPRMKFMCAKQWYGILQQMGQDKKVIINLERD